MAGLGYAIGGLGEGIATGSRLALARQELEARRMEIAKDQGLRAKAISLDERNIDRLEANDKISLVENQIAKSMEVIASTVEAGLQANVPRERIAQQVAPILRSIQGLAIGIDRDPQVYANQVDTLVTQPTTAEAAKVKGEGEAAAKVAERDALVTQGVPKEQADVAAGIAQKMSLFDQMLMGGGGATQSTGPLPFEPDQTKREIGKVYNLPNGAQALWTRDPSGNVGWELLNAPTQ